MQRVSESLLSNKIKMPTYNWQGLKVLFLFQYFAVVKEMVSIDSLFIYFYLAVAYATLVAFRPTYRWFRWMFRYLKESRIDTIAHTISTSSKIIQNRMESYAITVTVYLWTLYYFMCLFAFLAKLCWNFVFEGSVFLFYWFAFLLMNWCVIIWTWLSSWNIRCAHQSVLNNEHINIDIQISDSLSSIFFFFD